METIEEYKVGYKKTKLGWIPDDWKLTPLGKLCFKKGKYGIGASAVEYRNDLPTYLRITDIDDFGNYSPKNKVSLSETDWQNYLLKKGDILFVRTGSATGKTYLYKAKDGNLVYAGFLIKFTPNPEKLLPLYLSLFTSSSIYYKWVSVMSVRSGQPGINSEEYALLPIPLPRIPEQQKIATILSDWDLAIENLQSLIEKLKRRKKGLMQQLLTGKKRLPGFSEEWQEQKLGALIIDCKKKTTEQDEYEILTSSNKGLLPQKEYFGKGRISDKKNIGFHVLPPNHITYRSRSDDGKFTFNLNELGYTGIISHYYPVFKMKDGDNKFFVEYANTNKNKFGRYSVGTSQLVLSFNEIKKMKVTFPSPEEQRAISNVLNIAHQEIAEQQNYLEQLQAQKKGLMQQLLTGKVRVKV